MLLHLLLHLRELRLQFRDLLLLRLRAGERGVEIPDDLLERLRIGFMAVYRIDRLRSDIELRIDLFEHPLAGAGDRQTPFGDRVPVHGNAERIVIVDDDIDELLSRHRAELPRLTGGK